MLFNNSTYIGIDPTAGKRPIAFAALDNQRSLLALGMGDYEEVLAFVAGQRQAIVAVCSPARPNQRRMEDETARARLNPQPKPGRWTNFRTAEYLLRQHNIPSPQTPADEEQCPNWMRIGFTIYRRLESFHYQPYPSAAAERQVMEVYPHACYTVLLGRQPFPKNSLEGRLQRQLALYDCDLDIPDPMDFFEEITSHRLMQGQLPLANIYQPGELDAMAAAYTAWLAANRPDQVTCLGEAEEGFITLPAAEIKTHY